MAKEKPETILLKGSGIYQEAQATAIIQAGYLVEIDGENGVRPQSVQRANCRRAFALENDLLGKGINDGYKVGERVRYVSLHQGNKVYAKVAGGAEAIAVGDALEASGKGTVRKLTEPTVVDGKPTTAGGFIIGYALEAVNNSTAKVESFIKMEVA